MVKVKVCGITNIDDARCAANAGADFIGFIFEPTSVRFCKDTSFIPAVRDEFPDLKLVAVFGNIPKDFDRSLFDAVQGFDTGCEMPAIRPRSKEELAENLEKIETGKILVLDAFHPNELGGTGKIADWPIARMAVEKYDGSVMLAGGLAADNVQEAIREVQPFAVDASSRLESEPGRKDHQKVIDFVRAAKNC